jgi:hypothetical protein
MRSGERDNAVRNAAASATDDLWRRHEEARRAAQADREFPTDPDCRYATNDADHQCTDYSGAPIRESASCWYEANAQMHDQRRRELQVQFIDVADLDKVLVERLYPPCLEEAPAAMSTAVERYTAPAVPDISDRQWNQLERKAKVFAKSNLAPERWRGDDKVDDIMAVGLTLHSVGVDLTLSTLNQSYVIGGQVQMMAQLQMGIAASHGIDCWFEPDDVSETAATICIRKPGSTRVDRYRYSIDMARKAHLLDEWVERWQTAQSGKKYPERIVVAVDGQAVKSDDELPDWAKREIQRGYLKRKDPWFNNRQQMLMARATTLGLKVAAPGALIGLPTPDFAEAVAEEPTVVADTGARQKPLDLHEDDDIVDAELVGDDTDGAPGAPEDGREATEGEASSPSPAAPAPAGELASERERLQDRIAQLGPQWKNPLSVEWKKRNLPALSGINADQVGKVDELIDVFFGRKHEFDDKRRKHVNAQLNEIGIKDDDDRHAFIRAATNGETESSMGMTDAQLQAFTDAVNRRKAEIADAGTQDDQPPLDLDPDDSSRPFE